MGKSSRKKDTRFLAGHQRSWLWGRHPVVEALEAGRWPVAELYLSSALSPDAAGHAATLARGMGALVETVLPERLRELAHAEDHQGYLARMGPFPYAAVGGVLEDARLCGDGAPPLFLVLDAVQDTFNFGAIIRSAEALGARAVFVGATGQAGVNSLVARASAGAVNRIPVAETDDLPGLARTLRERGVFVAAADEKEGVPCAGCDFRRPSALVLGNEGRGVGAALAAECDGRVRIPMAGGIASLNVAAAAAVLLYEVWRQKHG